MKASRRARAALGVAAGAVDKRLAILLVLVCALAAPSAARAHPYHVSLAEAKVNHEKQRLEVALRVFPEDLEAALTHRFERDVNLERTEDVDALIAAYLREVFTLGDPSEPAVDEAEGVEEETAPARFALAWAGKEVEVRHMWLYFTISLDRGIEGLEISNRVMFDVEPTQENSIVLTDGEERVTLRCDRERPKVAVTFPDASEESEQ